MHSGFPSCGAGLSITIVLLAICRVGVFIPVPGADIAALARFFENAGKGGGAPLLNLANMFSGGGAAAAAGSSRWA